MADVSPSAALDALRRPSAFTADPSGLRRFLAAGGDDAQATLKQVVNGTGNTAADQVAAAVILAAHFDHTSALGSLNGDDLTDPEVLDLDWSEDLHPRAREALSEPVIMSLLTWASTAATAEPPLAAARTAATLGIDDDGAIYRKVTQRAVQQAEQRGTHRARKDQLRSFTESLGQADQKARQSRGTATATPAGTEGGSDSQPATDAGSGSVPGAEPGATSSNPASAETAGEPSSPPEQHPEHTADAQPSGWSARDDHALDDLLGRRKPTEKTTDDTPGDKSAGPEDPNHGQPVGFNDATTSHDTPVPGETGPRDEPRYGDRFEDERWSGDGDQGGGPGPRRAYDPRALTDGPMSEAQKADEKNVLRNWGITAAVLVGILVLVGLLL